MAAEATWTISLPPELARFVDRRLSSGRAQSVTDVVVEGLRLLASRESDDESFDGLREKIAVGLAQAERGELLDGEEVFRELEQRFVQPSAT